jgi:hypothetical protein
VMNFQEPFRYCSRYLGKRVEKRDSSVKAPAVLSSGLKGSICASIRKRDGKRAFHMIVPSTYQCHLYPKASLSCVWTALRRLVARQVLCTFDDGLFREWTTFSRSTSAALTLSAYLSFILTTVNRATLLHRLTSPRPIVLSSACRPHIAHAV